MSSITIRKLPDQTKERLRVQAAHSGISLEAHARGLLQRAAAGTSGAKQPDLGTLARQFFGPVNGVEFELPPRGAARETVNFD